MRAYETDYAGWAEDTARAICEGRWSDIDRAALADEVDSLGKQERQRIVSRLTQLIIHLLKQRYQPMKASRSWELTILEQRRCALDLLGENPSVQPLLADLVSKAYREARYRAIKQTGLDPGMFPEENSFTETEIWGDKPDQ